MDELKAAGFLEAAPPSGFNVPQPTDALAPDEDPYEGEEDQDALPPSDDSASDA
jgi:segregation and condensation protein B